MSRFWLVLGVLLGLVVAGRCPAADPPAADDKLAPLERFAGEWTVDGKWTNGEVLHARSVYEWGLGKKILKVHTYVMNGDKEYQRYEGVLAWHPEKKSLFEISFSFDGSITEYLIESTDKDTLRIGWQPFDPNKQPRVRQVIRFLDKDSFQWTVTLKDGEDWKPLIDATWKRKQR